MPKEVVVVVGVVPGLLAARLTLKLLIMLFVIDYNLLHRSPEILTKPSIISWRMLFLSASFMSFL